MKGTVSGSKTEMSVTCLVSVSDDGPGRFCALGAEAGGGAGEDSRCAGPVSYTHLDVYKRQDFWCSGTFWTLNTSSKLA